MTLIEYVNTLAEIDSTFEAIVERKDPKGQIPTILKWVKEYHKHSDSEIKFRIQNFLQNQQRVENRESTIKCSSNCSSCCHHNPHSIEPFESLSLYLKIRERDDFEEIILNAWENQQKFESMIGKKVPKSFTGDAEDFVFESYFQRKLPCPLLDSEGNCSEYHHRPNTCRLFVSISDPKFCTPELASSPQNMSFLLNFDEAIEVELDDFRELWQGLDIPEGLFASLIWWNQFEDYFTHYIAP